MFFSNLLKMLFGIAAIPIFEILDTMAIRINKYLSQCSELSRRAADDAVSAGRVSVNGRTAITGESIDPESDVIKLDGRILTRCDTFYLAAYKPRNMVTTMNDPEGRKCIKEIIPERYKGVFPAGRLDFNAEGLIILTNDGDMANSIHHPTRNMPKVYIVILEPKAPSSSLIKMAEGIELEGRLTRRCLIERLKDQNGTTMVRITLKQGIKNQIKRMAEALGLSVTSIKRIAVGPVLLGNMKPGQIRELSHFEINALKNIQKKHKVT